jgi:hypothetical protein
MINKTIVSFILLLLFSSIAIGANPVTGSFPLYWKEVVVTDPAWGAACNNSTDDTAAIQSAIDYATTNNIQTIYIPGRCKFTPPLFLDLPGNLRGADGTHGASYGSGTNYSQGQTVNSGGIAYISLINSNIGNTPASSPSDWQVYAYNSATTYAAGAIVSYQCATCYEPTAWLSIQGSNTGNTPSLSSSYWRSWVATPTSNGFTACIRGGYANPLGGLPGTLYATSNAASGLWVGPGSGNCVQNLAIVGSSGATNGEQNPSGVAISISGGATKTTITNVNVSNFYFCFQAAINDFGDLGEDNVFINPVCSNAWTGFDFENQADVNLIVNANVQATIGVRSTTPLTTVIGGEWGPPLIANSFSISSISSVTAATCPERSGITCYSFSLTVASPDSHWPTQTFALYASGTTYSAGSIVSYEPNSQGGDPSTIRLWQSLSGSNTGNTPFLGSAYWVPVSGQGNYSAFPIVTTGFGVIPLELTGWNSSTGVATFTTFTSWAANYLTGVTALSQTDLQTEIQAATKVYAVERQIILNGGGFHAQDMWMQPGAPTCVTLLDANTNLANKIEFFHYDG